MASPCDAERANLSEAAAAVARCPSMTNLIVGETFRWRGRGGKTRAALGESGGQQGGVEDDAIVGRCGDNPKSVVSLIRNVAESQQMAIICWCSVDRAIRDNVGLHINTSQVQKINLKKTVSWGNFFSPLTFQAHFFRRYRLQNGCFQQTDALFNQRS